MSRSVLMRSAFTLALLVAANAHAATDADLAQIRDEIRQMKDSYEARIRALEQRLQEATARDAAPASPASPQIATAAAPAPTASPTAGIAAFNPAISAVLQGSYANLSQDPAKYAIRGFAPSGDIGPGRRGFRLGESEVAISANVDHLFAGNVIVSLTPENTVSVEEAYGIYTAALWGVVPKLGRFFSGIGYMNEQHQHAWDFIDAPLAYQAFLGGQYANDGVQLKWIAPTEHFIEIGAEAGSGNGFPGTDRNKNGVGSGAVYAHTGGDIGASHSWRAGLSYLQTRPRDRSYAQRNLVGTDAQVAVSGPSQLAIADFVWQYAPTGNATETNFKLQGEYFRRRERGDFTYDANGALGLTSLGYYRANQSGWYLQGIYQFMPYWRVGARYDRLDPGTVNYGTNAAYLTTPPFNPERATLMFDYTPSEFSRVRLQFAQSKTQPGQTDHQLFLQYILTIGAHGAHRF